MITEHIAVVSVVGTLVSRSGYLDAASGLRSYGDIAEAIAAAMDDASVRGVILDIDSPGGEVGGLFDLVEQIQAIKSAGAKPLWAVASESALSAAYAIASTADRLYVTRTGEVGSIGVVAVHVDESGAEAKAGLAWTFVFAGEQKVDGNAHEPLSQRARATIQADIDRLYSEFCGLVAANRGLTIETVRGTNAAIYAASSPSALDLPTGSARSTSPLPTWPPSSTAPRQRARSSTRHPEGATPWQQTRPNGSRISRTSRKSRPRLDRQRRMRRLNPRACSCATGRGGSGARSWNGRAAARRVRRGRRHRGASRPAWRHGGRRRRAEEGRCARCLAPLGARYTCRARRGIERHRSRAVHPDRRRQSDRAARQGTRRGIARLINVKEHPTCPR